MALRYEDRYVVTPAGCWEWKKPSTQPYGRLRHNGSSQLAHRVIYEMYRGAIPPGLELDHLCRNTGCVNPEHLEPVTHAENVRRGQAPTIVLWRAGTCNEGHSNRYLASSGKWVCRDCRNRRKHVAKSRA